jgi:xanthine/uracil permease
MGWRDSIIGDYNWAFLCLPSLKHKRAAPPFYGKDEKISLVMATIMGLQHALSMVGGIITPPLLISSGFTPEGQNYLVSAALIVSSIASLIQIIQIPIPFTRLVIGSGLLSVMGISFSFVPIAEQVIATLNQCTCAGVACSPGGTCDTCTTPLEGNCLTEEKAYGKILGTIMVCCWYQVLVSVCPPRALRRIFPPVVTGSCLILLGISLVTTGFQEWGGGSYWQV